MKGLVGSSNQEKALGAFSVIVKTDGSFAALASTLNLAPTPTFTQTLHHHRKILILMINDAIIDRLEINRRTECRPCLILYLNIIGLVRGMTNVRDDWPHSATSQWRGEYNWGQRPHRV